MRRALAIALLLALAPAARADGNCRLLEINFQPTNFLQLAVWIEDSAGHYVDTAWVTRATGALGLANRPGNARFKSAYRWPYGRREMVLPIWAHRRNRTYGYVVMGGASGADAHDDSIGYHEGVSSTEPFYCAPSLQQIDAVSCASQFTGSKGLYAPGQSSLYPPRADLTSFSNADSADARTFAAANDLAAISGATPPGGRMLDQPIVWVVPPSLPPGQYVVRVEASLEGDFNMFNNHPAFADVNTELRSFGHEPFGQPSIVFSVPILLDGSDRIASVDAWDGYSTWDGSDGELHPPDLTISDTPGSGAGRLAHVTDGDGTWRVKVSSSGCAGCMTPPPPGALSVTPAGTEATVVFAAPAKTGALDGARSYDVRYRPGPLADGDFSDGIPADRPPLPAAPGVAQSLTITGLKAETSYTVGVRSVNACGDPSPAQFAQITTTQQQFVTLHGCFVATAAFGSTLAPSVALLRRFRDRALYRSPFGQLFAAIYYALSPPLARAIATDDRLRALARGALGPAVALARAWLLSEDALR